MQWARFMQCVPDTKNIFFGKEGVAEDQKKRGYIVITADKGLAGAYNHNVLKLASEEIEKHPQSELFVVGELGRQYFMKKNVYIDGEFSYTVQNPTLYRARHIGLQMLINTCQGTGGGLHYLYKNDQCLQDGSGYVPDPSIAQRRVSSQKSAGLQ